MTATPSIDMSGWLHEQLAQASPDLLRAMVSTFAEALMGAEADAVCGAPFGERSSERTNTRNGLPAPRVGHPRRLDRAGDPEASLGQLLPGLAAGTPSPGRGGTGQRRRDELPAGGVDAADGEAGRDVGQSRSTATPTNSAPTSTSAK